MAVMGRSQGARAARKAEKDLLAGAGGAGWSLDEAPEGQSYPEHLSMHLVKPVQRTRVVRGDDFDLTTWKCKRISGGRVRITAVVLHVLTMPAEGVDLELFFGRMPEARHPIVMPEAFRDRVAMLPEARVMAGGDIEKVLAELEPHLGAIAGPGLALVVWHGQLTLISFDQPDVAALQEWTVLGRDIVSALTPA